jgi:acylphosphatase
VQGVWFRAACAEQARLLGVEGSARNLPDGRVEVLAQGEKELVERLVEWCRHGPPTARVTRVEVQYEVPGEALDGFIVL